MPLGHDLATIRKSQNLTLEDIQSAIKIPISTLKSIEDESIFRDDSENQTYRRSFIRSYAKVLKLDDKHVVTALDAMEVGNYRTGMLTGESTETVSEKPKETPVTEDPELPKKEEPKPKPEKAPSPQKTTPPPAVNSVNWADMGRKFSPVGKNSRTWLILLIIIFLGLLAGAAYVFSDELTALIDPNPSDQLIQESGEANENSTPIDTAAAALNQVQPDETATPEVAETVSQEPITLGDTLTVTIYAAYGQLEPIRVTSDFNWRTNPFWMEEGAAYNFDFKDTLLVRGQYSRLLLLFNGHPIENPRQNYFDRSYNSIMITRSALNQQRYLAPSPEEFPLEVGAPDSVVYAIRY